MPQREKNNKTVTQSLRLTPKGRSEQVPSWMESSPDVSCSCEQMTEAHEVFLSLLLCNPPEKINPGLFWFPEHLPLSSGVVVFGAPSVEVLRTRLDGFGGWNEMDSQVPPNPKQSDSVGTHLLPDLLGIILTSSPSSQLVFHTSLRRMGE